jgi:GNAT superfamily N-acetyltransferase
MILEIVSKENAGDYREFLPDSFFRTELMLGIVCIDEEREKPVGFTMLTVREESLLIEYIYVLEEYRRRGAGTMMLEGAVEMAEVSGIGTLEIYYNAIHGSEDITRDFLFVNSFLICEEGELLEFISTDLLYSDYVKNIKYPKELDGYDCISVGELSEKQESRLARLLERNGGSDFLTFCSSDMSYLCEKDGEEKGCILCGYDEEASTITIMELAVFSNDPMCVAKLLITLGHYVAKIIQKETVTLFLKTQEFKVTLAQKLLGDERKLKSAGVLLRGARIV